MPDDPDTPVVEGAAPTARVERSEGVSLASSTRRRAFVPGQLVHLAGNAPGSCEPVLRVDGERVSSVETDQGGDFSIDVDTSALIPGRHRAEVVCANGAVLETGFWVASPQTSSSTLSVVLVAILVLGALGWAGVRGLVSSTATKR